jgi:hypothetical protein
MKDKLKAFSEKMMQGRPGANYDASRFNDPLAMETSWIPLKSASSSFRTHQLVEKDTHRVEFEATKKAKQFSYLIMGSGVFFPFVFLFNIDFSQSDAWMYILFLALFAASFIIAGRFILRKMSEPIIFDKWEGKWWKGESRKENGENLGQGGYLNEIHAIQLLSEYRSRDKGGYYVYELNFVLNNADRVQVLCHGGERAMLTDAEKLSRFLEKPLWNAS